MQKLILSLLGAFQVSKDGKDIETIESIRGRALLAYLAVESDRPHSRDALAAFLWPQQSQPRARQNLRRVLYNLRQALDADPDGEPYLLISRHEVRFNRASDYWLDVAVFKELIDGSHAHHHRRLDACSICMERLQEAANLYRGDFLCGLILPDSDNFEEWRTFKLDALQGQMLQALSHLAAFHERRREYEVAATYLRRQLELAPWREEAHRGLMRILALGGQRSAALNQFEVCRRTLADQLSASPSAETLALYRRIEAGNLVPRLGEIQNPYKGLLPFTELDAPEFFGREGYTDSLLAAIHETSLVAVIGPSGSGKSSVIQAGLIPTLDAQDVAALSTPSQDAGTASSRVDWFVVTCRPGGEPAEALADVLAPLITPGESARHLAADLLSGERTLDQVALSILQSPASEDRADGNGRTENRLLIVIDHFEEVFTLVEDRSKRRAFLDVLLRTAERSGSGQPGLLRARPTEEPGSGQPESGPCAACGPLTVLLSLRADFVAQAMSYRPMADAIQRGSLILGPMDRTELRRAIVEPARLQGVPFEPGLVERLLDDVGDEPGNLPLLEFSLTLLWQLRQNGKLAHKAYEAIGTLSGALARYADHVYQQLDVDQQQRAQQIFVQLIQPGIGTEDTRRLATREELGEENWRVIQKLADERLVVTNQDSAGRQTAEVAHEALIHNWGLLRSWIDADREFRIWQQRLRAAVDQWKASAEDAGALLRGAPLAEAEGWIEQRREDVGERELAFIAASQEQRDRERAAEEARRQQELDQAQALAASEYRRAESEARAGRLFRWLTFALAAALILAVIAAGFAFRQTQLARQETEAALSAEAVAQAESRRADEQLSRAEVEAERAESQAQLALSRQLAAQALNEQDSDLDRALLLSLESLRLSDSAADRTALLSRLDVNPLIGYFIHGEPEAVELMAFPPPENLLIIGNPKGGLSLRNVNSGQLLAQPLPLDARSVVNALSPDGRLLALAQEATIQLWDTTSGEQIGPPLTGHETPVKGLCFSNDGTRLLTTDSENVKLIWDTTSGEIVKRMPEQALGFGRGLSPDGNIVVLTTGSGSQHILSLWNVALDRPINNSVAELPTVQELVFSPDGALFATATFDGNVYLWDARSGQAVGEPLAGHRGRALAVAFSPDGRLLASGGTDNSVRIWNLETGQVWGPPLHGHSNWVRSLAFHPDGSRLVSGDQGGHVIVWNLDGYRELAGHLDRVRSVALSPDENLLVTAGFGGIVSLWDAVSGELLQAIDSDHESSIMQVVFSPAGDTFATGDATGHVIIWDRAAAVPRHLLKLDNEAVVGLAFSPDGATLATGDFGGTIALWDVAGGERKLPPVAGAHDAWVLSLAFSPDGALLASGGFDTTIRLWDAATLASIGEPMDGHEGWVTSLLFSEDGETLISSGGDNRILTWDVASRRPLANPLVEQGAQVWSIAMVSNGDTSQLVSLTADGNVTPWDPDSGEPLAPPLRSGRESEGMAISADGTRLFLGSFGPLATVWGIHPASWQERACDIARRNLTEVEWEQYLPGETYRKTCSDLP